MMRVLFVGDDDDDDDNGGGSLLPSGTSGVPCVQCCWWTHGSQVSLLVGNNVS